ncbi:hypothetical protein RND71_039317 [Anisodus tanguticus]|uniref:U-box domain-containing protein n=1 Tax=Anisodus tanguticus TaxID=243964 RepID=A0AAE1QX34_9SOLA|nr:hypothetical protein RND71_039317 [Anisodus tanguticus]
MWRVVSSLPGKGLTNVALLLDPSTATSFQQTTTLFSDPELLSKGKKRDEDFMPIANGHEREELEEAPAIVKSVYDKRIVGCPGDEGEDEHDVVWFWLEKGKPHECPVCSQCLDLRKYLIFLGENSGEQYPQVRGAIAECLSELQSESHENQQKALLTLVSITKVSPQNRNLLTQADGAISTLLSLSMSPSSTTTQLLALSILFNLSLNPNLKQSLADMDTILFLNSVILSSTSAEPSRIAASLLCSLAMIDKNKAKFGVAGTVEALIKAISKPRGPASHHFLSTLAELVQFHGNCTVAVRSGAVRVLIKLVENSDCEDLGGTSLAILCLLARFEEGLTALKETDQIVPLMMDILKGKCMLSKEGAADILLRLFDESEGCISDALRLPEFSSVLADLSVRGSVRAREKASLLMKKLMEANMDDVYGDIGNKTTTYLQW